MESKRFNLNSGLLVVLTIVLGICGWSLTRNVDTVRDDIKQIRTDMVPRNEVTLQIQEIKAEIARTFADTVDTRVRVSQLEVRIGQLEVNLARAKQP